MNKQLLFQTILLLATASCFAQSSPPAVTEAPYAEAGIPEAFSMTDTITFTSYATGTIISNQYQVLGALFAGHNGSLDPVTQDYGPGSFGSVVHSDNWYNAMRLNFVDSLNPSVYRTVSYIEFDNPIYPEDDYIDVRVYDVNDSLLYQYMSLSPEHVTINVPPPYGAYITFDDSLNSAYVIDNILFDFSVPTGLPSLINNIGFDVYPSPFQNELNVVLEASVTDRTGISIINMLGETVMHEISSEKQKGSPLTLNTSALRAGVYFLKVTGDGAVGVKKIVKQ
jgi:hypothetical protein